MLKAATERKSHKMYSGDLNSVCVGVREREMYSGDLMYSEDLNNELLIVHFSNASDALYHGLNSQPF